MSVGYIIEYGAQSPFIGGRRCYGFTTYGGKVVAAGKSRLFNHGYVFRYGDGVKRNAIAQQSGSNARQPLREPDGSQLLTVGERRLIQLCNAFRYGDFSNSCSIKCVFSDFGEACRQFDGCEVKAIFKSIISDSGDSVGKID